MSTRKQIKHSLLALCLVSSLATADPSHRREGASGSFMKGCAAMLVGISAYLAAKAINLTSLNYHDISTETLQDSREYGIFLGVTSLQVLGAAAVVGTLGKQFSRIDDELSED